MGKTAEEPTFAPSPATDDRWNTLGVGNTDHFGDCHNLWPPARPNGVIIEFVCFRSVKMILLTFVKAIEVRISYEGTDSQRR